MKWHPHCNCINYEQTTENLGSHSEWIDELFQGQPWICWWGSRTEASAGQTGTVMVQWWYSDGYSGGYSDSYSDGYSDGTMAGTVTGKVTGAMVCAVTVLWRVQWQVQWGVKWRVPLVWLPLPQHPCCTSSTTSCEHLLWLVNVCKCLLLDHWACICLLLVLKKIPPIPYAL